MPHTPNTPKVECPTCAGCGRVDTKDGKPWCEVNATPNADVRAGFNNPKQCPNCDGWGKCDEEIKPVKPSAVKPAAPAIKPT